MLRGARQEWKGHGILWLDLGCLQGCAGDGTGPDAYSVAGCGGRGGPSVVSGLEKLTILGRRRLALQWVGSARIAPGQLILRVSVRLERGGQAEAVKAWRSIQHHPPECFARCLPAPALTRAAPLVGLARPR